GLRHAQRSGAAARDRAVSVRALQLRSGCGLGEGQVMIRSAKALAERCRSPERLALLLWLIASAVVQVQQAAPFDSAQGRQPDWRALEPEIMRHYQAVLRLDTTNPPGNEHLAVEYLKQVFDAENIPSEVFALDPNRSNIVARLKGSGKKRPLLIMGHTDD